MKDERPYRAMQGYYYFAYFCSKTWAVGAVRTEEAVLTCTHYLCFGAKIRKRFYYVKWALMGVYVHCTDMFS